MLIPYLLYWPELSIAELSWVKSGYSIPSTNEKGDSLNSFSALWTKNGDYDTLRAVFNDWGRLNCELC